MFRAWPLALLACSFSKDLPNQPRDGDPDTGDGPKIDAPMIDAPMIDAASCPQSYQLTSGASRYRFVNNTATWLNAQTDCADDGAGTHLAIPNDVTEDDFLADAISGASATGWIGVSDRVTEGMYRVVVGGTTYFVDWYTGASDVQPDNDGNVDCVEIVNDSQTENPAARGKHYDESCNSSRVYVCECDGVASDPSAY